MITMSFTMSERAVLRALVRDFALVITRPPRAGFYSVVTASAAKAGDVSNRIGHKFQARVVKKLHDRGFLNPVGLNDSFDLTAAGKVIAVEVLTEMEHTENARGPRYASK